MAGLQSLSLEDLRAKITRLENRPLLGGGQRQEIESPEDLLTAPSGTLHEIFSDDRRGASPALAFALGQARPLLKGRRSAIVVLGLKHEAQDIGFPYGAGFAHFGVDPDAVVIGIVETLPELLWAIEEAVGCSAVAAVVADVAGTPAARDFTVSRRMSLRAAASGTSVFMLRYGLEREVTAAQLRWRLGPMLSTAPPFDDRAVGDPRFRAVLEKGRLAREGLELLLEWTSNGFVVVDDTGTRAAQRPAPHGAEPAALGHRLSKAS